jgi:hypothetical protein
VKIIITKHAARRIKERMGLPKKAAQKLALDAWEKGVDYAEMLSGNSIVIKLSSRIIRKVYGKFVYVFKEQFCECTLITVYRLRVKVAV